MPIDPTRLRVVMVRGPAPPGQDGVSDYTLRLAGALSEAGVDVVDLPVRPGAPVKSWLMATVRAAGQVHRRRPQLVHVQFAPSAYRFSRAPHLLPGLLPRGVPLITTVHEYDGSDSAGRSPGRRVSWDRATGLLVPRSRTLIVTNHLHAEQLAAGSGRRPVEIPLAPNVPAGPADADGARQVRSRWGLPHECPLVVFFGFVHPVKGVRHVLEALPALRADRPDLHFLVVGGFASQALPGPEARAFRAELDLAGDALGVTAAVTFTEHLPATEVSTALRAADAAVLPFTAGVTLKSGALLAALAHGVPTAVTVPDDPDSTLRDGVNVAVIPRRRDADAVATTLRRLLDDESLRRRLSAGGLALTADRSWSRVARQHRRLYEDVLGGRRA